MPSVIRSSLMKMSFVLFLLGLMAYWQFDFVTTAIGANVFLNSCIIGTFAFGVYTAFSRVFGLKNDIIAFRALREDYEDATNGSAQDEKDIMWRYYRCKEDAVVFVKPKILERPYTILSEEIARQQHLSVSTSVMQNLLDSVDEQLDEGKSLVAYVTGLLVFLGLIGTFIGLMVTLGSVGEIIGGLDLSGGAGAAAIQKLMDDLKIPLNGMATGFSSSLFGLITSLVLGLIALFSNQASGTLKADFGTWLANVAKVDAEGAAEQSTSGGQSGFSVEGERMLSIMYRVAKINLVSNARVVTTVEEVSKTTRDLMNAQLDSQDLARTVALSIQDLSRSVKITNQSIEAMAGHIETRGELRQLVDQLGTATTQQSRNLDTVQQKLTQLALRHAQLQERADSYKELFARRDEIETLAEDTQVHIDGEFAKLHGSVENLKSTLYSIEAGVGHSNHALTMTQHNLGELSERVGAELAVAIEHSRQTIAEARDMAEKYQDLEFMEAESNLNGIESTMTFGAASDRPNETKASRLIGFLRRRG